MSPIPIFTITYNSYYQIVRNYTAYNNNKQVKNKQQ